MRRKFFNALGAAMALVMLLALSSAMAAEKTWTNGNGDGKWGTGANWNPAGAPGAGDIAVFNDNANITVSTSVADIAIRVLNDVEVALKSEGSGKLTLKGSDEPIKEEDIKGKASLLVAEGATLTTEADCLALPNAHAAIVLDGNLELGSNLEVPSGKVLHIKTENYRGALTGNVAGLVFTDSTSTIAFYGDVTLDGAKKIIDTVGGGAIEMAESWSILTATHKDTFVVNGPVIFKNSEGTCWSTLKLEAQLPDYFSLKMGEETTLDVTGSPHFGAANTKVTMAADSQLQVNVPEELAEPFATFEGTLVITDPARFTIWFNHSYLDWEAKAGEALTVLRADGGLMTGDGDTPLALEDVAKIAYYDGNMRHDVGTGDDTPFKVSLAPDLDPTTIRLTPKYNSLPPKVTVNPDPPISVNVATGTPVPPSATITVSAKAENKPEVEFYFCKDEDELKEGLPPGMSHTLSDPQPDGSGYYVTTLTINFGDGMKNGKYACTVNFHYNPANMTPQRVDIEVTDGGGDENSDDDTPSTGKARKGGCDAGFGALALVALAGAALLRKKD